MEKKRTSNVFVWGIWILLIAVLGVVWICNQLVVSNAIWRTFDDIDDVQYRETGLLLGTTPQTRIGNRQNLFFKYRIDAAEELYKAGKIGKILISGDENSLDGINEPECMRDSLVARGVPAEDIILDGKGFRTIYSIINANQVHGLKSFTVISQQFHNERALYQAEHLGLDVENIQAFNAKSPVSEWAILTYVREYFARVKMFWDLWTFDDKAIRKNPASQAISSNDDKGGDSFTVVYRKPVNGYEVKAIVRPDEAIGGNDTVTVAEVVEWLNEDTFSVEAAAEWDSMNANGGYLPIRGAERYLDTIINHYHVVFIPEP